MHAEILSQKTIPSEQAGAFSESGRARTLFPTREKRRSRRGRASRLLVILLAAVVCGCASATKRYEQGAELESEGRYAEAAERYIQALRKDPGLLQARERLIAVSPLLMNQYMEDGERFRALGSYIKGANRYVWIDALVRDAGAVGVPLTLPQGYPASQRRAYDDAIGVLMSSGKESESRRRWQQALNTYEQIDTYAPTAAQRRQAAEARVRTALAWGEADFAAGHYRAAATRAELALDLLGGATHPASGRAESLRREAITQGTIHVAVAPVTRPKTTAYTLPPDFTSALNDELELHHWSQPPLFVAVLDPLVVRRELRFQGLGRRPLSPRGAVRVGRNLGADYVVTSQVEKFVAAEENVTFDNRRAQTRANQDTTYVVAKGRMDYELTVSFAVIDVHSGRKTRGSTCVVSASHKFERGEYDGNPDDLRLSSAERRLFDLHWQNDAAEEAANGLLDQMTDALAKRVFDELLACVP